MWVFLVFAYIIALITYHAQVKSLALYAGIELRIFDQ